MLTEDYSHRFARIESAPMGGHISRHRYICHYIIPFFPFVHWRNPEIGKRKIHGLFFFWESCSFPLKEFQNLQKKISAAPLDVRGPLAEAFLLPYKASPTEIAQAIPGLQKRAKELAEHHMVILGSFGMYDIFCWGSILGSVKFWAQKLLYPQQLEKAWVAIGFHWGQRSSWNHRWGETLRKWYGWSQWRSLAEESARASLRWFWGLLEKYILHTAYIYIYRF